MRERWARLLAICTAVVVLLVAAVFATLQNPSTRAPAPGSLAGEERASAPSDTPEVDAVRIARGRAVYDEEGCGACHSIAGDGNPGNPLDGVGERLDDVAIRDWIVAAESVREKLPPRVARAKQGYAGLPAGDLDALVAYLAALGASGEGS